MALRYRDDAVYVASKLGRVYAVRGDEEDVVLDISKEISGGWEQGLLGLAFTPDGKLLVVNFTNRKDASVTRVYAFDDEADERSKRDLFVVGKPTTQHNAGNVVFGPDDYMYLSLGDGGLAGDRENKAQSLNTLLGKIHRIEVLPDRSYQIPSDNPFARKKKARGEIWAYGFRNPWRFSFDRRTGDLWVGDVGRDQREEISFEPSASSGGLNYGWNRLEGRARFRDHEPPKKHVLPVYDYKHTDDVCAVTGGYVYRGSGVPALYGAYLFADFCKRNLEALRLGDDGKVSEYRAFDIEVPQASSFGQDAEGELYVLSLSEGAIYRIDPA
jgi:glucose/arabinose dehydrogenase